MDLSRTRVVLRERSAVDVLDLALRFVVVQAGTYAKAAAFVVPPFFVLSWFVARSAGWWLGWVCAVFTATFVAVPFTILASRLVFEDDVRVLPALKTALVSAPRLFVLRFVTVFGSAFLLLPLFVTEVLVLERARVREAVSRSRQLVRAEWGEAIAFSLLLGVIELVVLAVSDIAGRLVVSVLLETKAPTSLWEAGGSALSLLGFWLFVPYVATARFLLYVDVRTRSEGWDIQTRFMAIAARLEDAAPSLRGAA